jgi:hypothetical protein
MITADQIPITIDQILAYGPCDPYSSTEKILSFVPNRSTSGTLEDLLSAKIPLAHKIDCIIRLGIIPVKRRVAIRNALVNRILLNRRRSDSRIVQNTPLNHIVTALIESSVYNKRITTKQKIRLMRIQEEFILERILALSEISRAESP